MILSEDTQILSVSVLSNVEVSFVQTRLLCSFGQLFPNVTKSNSMLIVILLRRLFNSRDSLAQAVRFFLQLLHLSCVGTELIFHSFQLLNELFVLLGFQPDSLFMGR